MAITTNIKLRRRLRLTRGRLVGRMSQERQKLSFFLVLMFLAIFGIIVLAEVLFMDGDHKSDIFYEDSNIISDEDSNTYETPKPFGSLLDSNHQLGGSNNPRQMLFDPQPDRLQESLRRHQLEMEKLIKNISAKIHKFPTTMPPPEPFKYDESNLAHLEFDFTLTKHKGFDAQWQPVNGTRHKFYVYSAYYDTRQPKRPLIRVIGATQTKKSNKVWCKMYFPKEPSILVPGGITIIRENWNLKYSACFVLCSIPTTESDGPNTKFRVPQSISIVSSPENHHQGNNNASVPKTTITNQLPVLNSDSGTGTFEVNSTQVGVCVKPMHFHYNKTLELIEFLELNQIFGVTRFTLYRDTVSEQVQCVLKHYEQLGTIEVLPWDLKIESQTEIRTEGLFAALNDCLYRNMNRFRYLMLIDFDEFIVPHMNMTIPQMLAHVDSQKIVVTGNVGRYGIKLPPQPKVTSAYSFQNAFFYLQFPDDTDAQYNLRVLQKTRRKSKFNPQKQRSKYICVPRNVKEAGNHFIWEFFRGSNLNVPTKFGYLHHYRVCEFGGDDCIHAENHVDRTMFSFRDQLVKQVNDVVHKLSEKCQLNNLLQETSSSSSEKSTISIMSEISKQAKK